MAALLSTITGDGSTSFNHKNAHISFIHNVTIIRLDNHNFLLWRNQVLATVEAHKLQRFLSAKKPPSRRHLLDQNTEETEELASINPEYIEREQQDQLLMPHSILSRIVSCETTAKITTCVNLFSLLGNSLITKQHIHAIFDGLPSEYDPSVLTIPATSDNRTVEEIETFLSAPEVWIEKYHKQLDSAQASLSPLQNFLSGKTRFQGFHRKFHMDSPLNQFLQFSKSYHGGVTLRFLMSEGNSPVSSSGFNHFGHGNGGGHRGISRGYWNQSKPQCQLSGNLNCSYRFDQSYHGPTRAKAKSARVQSFCCPPISSSNNNADEVFCNYMSATVALPVSNKDPNWYSDSGATHHVTPDEANFTFKQLYIGSEKLHLGNGLGLPIRHVGFSSFTSPYDVKTLSLTQMLHVPEVTRNILSVSRFSIDNNAFFEFHADQCIIKDRVTENVLLIGNRKDGLYIFDHSQISLLHEPTVSDSSPQYTSAHEISLHIRPL